MSMGKHHYTYFGEEVPKEIEKEYNRMCRAEQYQEEKSSKSSSFCTKIKSEYCAYLQKSSNLQKNS